MTIYEFDKKYENYLEAGFDGLSIEDEEIVNLVDKYFTEYVKVPGFTFAQIKNKYGNACVYCENVDTNELRIKIDKILKKRKNG